MLKTGPDSGNTDIGLSTSKSPGINPLDLSGMSLTAEDILSHVSPELWESMIRWKLDKEEPPYRDVEGHGGPGDYGVDVSAFWDDSRFGGVWEAYQGKHYDAPLRFTTVFDEIVKLVDGHQQEVFSNLPKKYVFVSPKGSGSTLQNLMNNPDGLKREFEARMKKVIAELGDKEAKPQSKKIAGKSYTKQQLEKIGEHAEKIKVFENVSFESKDLTYILGGTAGDRYYISKRRDSIPARDPNKEIPEEDKEKIKSYERLYVQKLVDVFNELDSSCTDAKSVEDNLDYGEEFRNQRKYFFAAEYLRLHVRDSVPEEIYERFKDDVCEGVKYRMNQAHENGRERLLAVQQQAIDLNLDAHSLITSIADYRERKGVCHQLADEDKLTWVK